MSNWKYICEVADIPRQGARRVPREIGLEVAIFRNAEDEIFALLDRCPHKGGPLSQGMVFGQRVACPMHNWSIGLCDGQAAAPDEGCTPSFQTKVEDDKVYLDAQELASKGLEHSRPVAGPVQRIALI
jgi:nitrite reductase (NADH) small subunit